MSKREAKHPKGLRVLFFTEMWERFGYYLMLGILALYLMDPKGGMGLPKAEAYDIVGTYLGLVYLTPFLGGLLADRILGYRKAILIGGVLMGLGYLGLAIPGYTALWTSLLLIIIGNGFFKPNISTLLGNLYSSDQYKKYKDAGYNFFYMGINIGAFVCNFVAAYMRNAYGWGYAFAAAGIGMFIGLAWFLYGTRHIKEADVIKPANEADMPVSKVLLYVFLPVLVVGALAWFAIPGNILGSDSTDAFIFGCVPVVIFYFSLWWKADKNDKKQISALLAVFAVVIVFWAVFKQNATALTGFAETYTDRQIPAKIQPVLKPFGMLQEVDTKVDSFPKYDAYFRPLKDVEEYKIKVLSPNPYFQNLPKDQWPAEGQKLDLISTEVFQSVNPFFIVLLTPLLVAFFAFLRTRGKEPSTPAKIGWGLFITGLSTLVMAAAVNFNDITTMKASAWWLIGSYMVVTVGELCLSPIGLSLVSKVSPVRITSLMMGGWFLSTSIGNKLSGVLASMWDNYDNKAYFFYVNFAACMLAALAIFAMIKWLRNIINQHS
ncbi:peptide MFS transporter [Solitalea koreensis]|uniref:Proton-dependent oligopeptide transporter, POT family n=1 Tax=Solitalea koreensis TaxID=543615 RepID=A0A521DA90_9SPHI|nr:peptide MFS transporter [Solitalea koreensis]SMO68545.1 proton-dependent oligopeptide transporter, POT family [Solitalea koreensis]